MKEKMRVFLRVILCLFSVCKGVWDRICVSHACACVSVSLSLCFFGCVSDTMSVSPVCVLSVCTCFYVMVCLSVSLSVSVSVCFSVFLLCLMDRPMRDVRSRGRAI